MRLHIATHCNNVEQLTCCSYQRAWMTKGSPVDGYVTLQHTAMRCNTLHHTATHCNNVRQLTRSSCRRTLMTMCNPIEYVTQQHTAMSCNTLQYAATHCYTAHCNNVYRLTRCSCRRAWMTKGNHVDGNVTLQHTATSCNNVRRLTRCSYRRLVTSHLSLRWLVTKGNFVGTQITHISHMLESCDTLEWVISHT